MAGKSLNQPKLLITLSTLALVACGGGGGGTGLGGGIGGTGDVFATSVSVGPITGFGSIYVNGVRYETTSASIDLDGDDALENELKLGMIVLVSGTISDDGQTGTATRIVFDDDVQGPVSAITTSTDGKSKTLSVLGISVLVDSVSTVFDGTTFDTLALNDLIEVSGFLQPDGSIEATRIERKSAFSAGQSEIEIKGQVANLSGNTFDTRGYSVDFSAAELSDFGNTALANGLVVEVKGTINGNAIAATKVELESDDDWGDAQRGSVEGSISNFVDAGNFSINGLSVNASNATLSPAGLSLSNGLKVEVEGNISNGVLIATRVEARDEQVEIAGVISRLDATNRQIAISFGVQEFSFSVDSRTRYEDDLNDIASFDLNNLSVGEFIEAHLVETNSGYLASEIERDETDDFEVQAEVESFVITSSITLLGVTFDTTSAQFRNSLDQSISGQQFFNALTVGDVIEIKDETGDGIAEEVGFDD